MKESKRKRKKEALGQVRGRLVANGKVPNEAFYYFQHVTAFRESAS
jgi:hypothetical protein